MSNPLPYQQRIALYNLSELYAKVPFFKCKLLCTDCCGPHWWAEVEWLNISNWLHDRLRGEILATHLDCPYIKDNRCSIYPVRPMICRIYGTVETLRCPHGCGPAKLLTDREAKELLTKTIHLLPPTAHGIGES